jgi:hypothetical protein
MRDREIWLTYPVRKKKKKKEEEAEAEAEAEADEIIN